MLHDWFDWSNAGVGVIGLGLTLLAVRQATGAKRAAKSARQAVYRRNTAEDIGRISQLASSLLAALETKQDSLVLHIARDFIAVAKNASERHRERLGTESGKLERNYNRVTAISQGIQFESRRADLIILAQKVVGDMSGLAGILSRDIEKEGQ
jgi:hypothetical protein